MEKEFFRIKDLNIIIYKNNNEYTLHKEVDFKKYPIKNYRNSLSLKIENDKVVLKTFYNNGIEELSSYVRNILNEKIELFLGYDKNNSVSQISCNKKSLEVSKSITGVINISSSYFEVVDTYSEHKKFQEENEDDCIYGMYCIEKKSFDFLFKHPLSVIVCFHDFGKNEVNKGSLFIKLKEIK